MTREEIAALYAIREQAWQRRDAAALAADYAEDAVVTSPTSGLVKSREAIEEVFHTWFAAFPDLEFKNTTLLVDGNRAALFATVTGTHVGEFFGMSASGRRFELKSVWLTTLVDGKISAEERIYDFTGMLVQIGILKAKPA